MVIYHMYLRFGGDKGHFVFQDKIIAAMSFRSLMSTISVSLVFFSSCVLIDSFNHIQISSPYQSVP